MISLVLVVYVYNEFSACGLSLLKVNSTSLYACKFKTKNSRLGCTGKKHHHNHVNYITYTIQALTCMKIDRSKTYTAALMKMIQIQAIGAYMCTIN